MNTATAVAIADDLPDQGWVGSCEIIRFPNPGMVAIYRDGVLWHTGSGAQPLGSLAKFWIGADEGRELLQPHLSDSLMMEPTMLDAARRAVELAA